MKIRDVYGGKCACCGERSVEFMTIDHIDGKGSLHRKELNEQKKVTGGYFFYKYLEKLGFPKDNYRVLCTNCNWSLGHFGYCPHKVDGVKFFEEKLKTVNCIDRAAKKVVRKRKINIINAYGGKCVCCGERNIEFLTIHHMDSNGAEHRRKLGGGNRLYTFLINNNYPKENFCLLCFNCNVSLWQYKYCPHNKK